MAGSKQDARQMVLREQAPFIGNAANEQLNVVFPRIDAEMAKLFEDRNILLTDGGTITFTGTQIQFTEDLNLILNQKISGAAPQVISLGNSSVGLANGEMWYATINRTAGTAVMTIGTTLPAVVAANQEIFLLARRRDATDGTQRLYFRNGSSMNAGQSVRLGQGGSGGSGSGVGDDLDALLFRASFADAFSEASTNAVSSIQTSGTNAVFNAAKNMYSIVYDAGKTVTGSGTAMTMSSGPAFSVAVGDVLIVGGQARKIVTVTSQTVYVIESAFTVTPAPSAAQATVSQCVYTKDIYGSALDGAAIATSFPGTTFSEIMVDYKDNANSGSNLWTPGVAPFVAFSASPDNVGANFTTKKVRSTLSTDTMQSTFLPTAGSALYMRFFATATAGAGIVNLINYKVFMQKTTSAVAGGVTNSAYAFTNGVGTPINATVSVVGGKTVITMPWAYAVGVLPGTTASSVEVYLNGSKLPRFADATLTPDASFIESSANSITLDRDYSSLNLSVEVFQRTQIVDSSTTNTTSIAAQQEIMTNGFQSFVAQPMANPTTAAGTPAGGTFYSTIVGRASMPDQSQDLRPRFGIDRISIQTLVQLQNEFGPNGQIVWASPNDTNNRMRFTGDWRTATNQVLGVYVYPASSNEYVEITFYGTGLNVLFLNYPSSRVATVSVDGGSTTNVTVATTSSSTVQTSRNVSPNNVANLVSGLALGVHTVKMGFIGGFEVFGFETVSQTAGLTVTPGVSYVGGKKVASTTAQTLAYNASVTGTRGGRTVVYQKADGTVGSSFTPVNAAAGFLAAADHTNEEVSRTYYPREFGAGRPDDYSIQVSSVTQSTFTLDDGTTNISSVNCTMAGDRLAPITNNNSQIVFTFVGTGLDIIRADDASLTEAGQYRVYVDFVDVGFLDSVGSTVPRKEKLVSGLPYGTHVVAILRLNPVAFTPSVINFITYQPKKPAIPSGAFELADYNNMAAFVPNAISQNLTISSGVLRKAPVREFSYVGGSWNFIVSAGDVAGARIETNGNGDYVEYTFFGTGLQFRFDSNTSDGSPSATVSIDGSSNLSAFTTAFYGTNLTPSSGSFTLAGSNGDSGLSIAGLTLGVHTIRITNNSTGYMRVCSLDIVTPVHAAKSVQTVGLQNILTVGSQSIGDTRKTTAIKEVLPRTKSVAQAIGSISGPTSTVVGYVPVPDMSITMRTEAGTIDLFAMITLADPVGANMQLAFFVDGQQAAPAAGPGVFAGVLTEIVIGAMVPVSAGIHKIDVCWYVSNGTLQALDTRRLLKVKEN